jgi:hypothetical protein
VNSVGGTNSSARLQFDVLSLTTEAVSIQESPPIECRFEEESVAPRLAIGHFNLEAFSGSTRQISVRWRYRLRVNCSPLISDD